MWPLELEGLQIELEKCKMCNSNKPNLLPAEYYAVHIMPSYVLKIVKLGCLLVLSFENLQRVGTKAYQIVA